MKTSPIVSVVLASFNGAKYIHHQVDSILKQSYEDFELIILDDASLDSTSEIIRRYEDLDARAKLYTSDKNLGLVRNFERGICLARGDFIVLADQDDIFSPDKIEKQLALMVQNPSLDLVISDLELIDEDANSISASMWKFQGINPSPKSPFRCLSIDNFATGCSIMFRRRLLQAALPFPSDLKIHDQWLAIVAARDSGGGIGVIDEPLTRYRQHKGNVIGAKSSKKIDWLSIGSKLFSLSGLKTYHQNSVQLMFEKRIRVLSFLERRDLFSEQEISYLKHLESVFTTYLPESNMSFIVRLSCLPRAFYISYFSRDFWRLSTRFILLTFFNSSPGARHE